MSQSHRITDAIFRAIDEHNDPLPPERRLGKHPDTVLYGKDGRLDSLGLVNLIVAIEENVNDELGVSLTLADEKALSQKNSPFRSVQTLADYIAGLLKDQGDASI